MTWSHYVVLGLGLLIIFKTLKSMKPTANSKSNDNYEMSGISDVQNTLSEYIEDWDYFANNVSFYFNYNIEECEQVLADAVYLGIANKSDFDFIQQSKPMFDELEELFCNLDNTVNLTGSAVDMFLNTYLKHLNYCVREVLKLKMMYEPKVVNHYQEN